MDIRKMIYVVIIIVFSLTLAACGGGEDNGGSNTGDVDSGTGGIELTKSIEMTVEELGLSVTAKYPDAWFALSSAEASNIVVGTDETSVNSFFEGDSPSEMPDNSVFVMMYFIPGEFISSMGLGDDAGLTDVFNMMIEDMGSDGTEIGEPTEVTVNGVEMVQVEGKNEEADGLWMASKAGDTIVFAICMTNPGELNNHMDECTAVAASVEISK